MDRVPPETVAEKFTRARDLHQQGQRSAALDAYRQILAIEPAHVDALNMIGVISGQMRDFAGAVEHFDRAITAAPGDPSPYCNRGLAQTELQQWDAALASFTQAIVLQEDHVIAIFSRGNVHRCRGRMQEALVDYDRAVALDPGFFPAVFNRAAVLQATGRLEEALAGYERTIAMKPDHAQAHAGRAWLLHHMRRFEEALGSYDHAIALNPDQALTYLHRGNTLKELRRFAAALADYDRAIGLDASFAEAHSNRGIALRELGEIDAALESYDRAIALKPDYAAAYVNRAASLRLARRLEAVVADYETATVLDPSIPCMQGARLEAKLQICDWRGLATDIAAIDAKIDAGELSSHPFAYLMFADSPARQRKVAETWARTTCPPDASLGMMARRPLRDKIRIGYFSADFRDHPTSRLMGELIERHDRSRFDVFGFSFGQDTKDACRKRLAHSFDRFLDVRETSDREITRLARSLCVDIAVDLGGYTHSSRPQIFALRAAPLQVNYLGYPGTMGTAAIDYLLADEILVPQGSECHFVEKVIYLPHSYQVNDRQRSIGTNRFTRAGLGLPPQGFVYCCFNNNYKILPDMFRLWMRILQRVPGSVLWLLEDNTSAAANLCSAASMADVDPARLIFAKRLPNAEHLARHRQADLFLDTLPYNGHTTASDALWTGLPVLSCPGHSFASRVAASLLTAVDLPELIAATPEDYENLAVELAMQPARLQAIRQKLLDNRLVKPLFDTSLFAKHLETGFTRIQERHLAGLAPEHIRVEP